MQGQVQEVRLPNHRLLGAFLRSRRHRLDPAVLGLVGARRRRTPGLRREEVAERAGISCEWYVKLEQGREVSPSAETLAALAAALVLDAEETAHLHGLARAAVPQAFVREVVPESVAAIVRSLGEPAYVTGARWDVLSWNAAAEVLFGFAGMAEEERNILLWMFTAPAAPGLFGESWVPEGRRMVGLFRAAHDRHGGDAAFAALVAGLERASPAFGALWSRHDVGLPSSGTKTLYSIGQAGATYAYASFQSNDDPALKLALYTRLG